MADKPTYDCLIHEKYALSSNIKVSACNHIAALLGLETNHLIAILCILLYVYSFGVTCSCWGVRPSVFAVSTVDCH